MTDSEAIRRQVELEQSESKPRPALCGRKVEGFGSSAGEKETCCLAPGHSPRGQHVARSGAFSSIPSSVCGMEVKGMGDCGLSPYHFGGCVTSDGRRVLTERSLNPPLKDLERLGLTTEACCLSVYRGWRCELGTEHTRHRSGAFEWETEEQDTCALAGCELPRKFGRRYCAGWPTRCNHSYGTASREEPGLCTDCNEEIHGLLPGITLCKRCYFRRQGLASGSYLMGQ